MPYIKKAYRGLQEHRYRDNPLEKRFASAWQGAHGDHPFEDVLRMLLRDQGKPRHKSAEPTARERLVAATVVQWLGSPVGQHFLSQVMQGRRAMKGANLGRRFASAWKDENSPPFGDTFRYLMCPPSVPQNNPPEVSDRDRKVAEKILEWLGTDDGQALINDAMQGKPPGERKPTFGRGARR